MALSLNIDGFTTSMSSMLAEIANGIPDIIQIIALDAKALIRNRIQEKGLNAEEQELDGYSPGYKKKKEKAGKYRGFTDMTLTGDMWRKTETISAEQRGHKYVVTVGGKDQLSENKIEWNSEHYGDILEVSSKEEQLLEQTMDDEIQKIIDQNGFGQ
ncbi:MAG: hypothetical protein V4549_06705 [Bacteroidota bacterium]